MNKMNTNGDSNTVDLRIPFSTFGKVFLAAFIGYCFYILWPFLLLVFLSVLIAVTLFPILRFLLKHRWPQWLAVLAITTTLAGLLGGTIGVVIPPLKEQVQAISKQLPDLKEKILVNIPERGGMRAWADATLSHAGKAEKWAANVLAVGQTAFGGVVAFLLMLIMSVYLLVDGKRSYEWLLAFLSPDNRKKAKESCDQISQVIFAYIAGQLITSVLASIYVFVVLTILKVPAAIVLALLAGIFDVLPVVGFFLSLLPAVLLALTISPGTALGMTLLYVLYHALENYLIVPKIYGTRLEVSGLVVLLALIMANSVAGVLGAIVILPIVASYPIIERIWLGKYVGREAIENHK